MPGGSDSPGAHRASDPSDPLPAIHRLTGRAGGGGRGGRRGVLKCRCQLSFFPPLLLFFFCGFYLSGGRASPMWQRRGSQVNGDCCCCFCGCLGFIERRLSFIYVCRRRRRPRGKPASWMSGCHRRVSKGGCLSGRLPFHKQTSRGWLVNAHSLALKTQKYTIIQTDTSIPLDHKRSPGSTAMF